EARPFDASELEPEDWEDERAGVPPSAQQELLKPFEHSVIEQLAHDLLNVDIYTQSSDDDGTNDVTATQLLEVLLDTVQYHKLDIKAKGFMLLDRQLSQRSVMIRHMLKAQVLVYPEVISAYKHFRSAMAVVPQLFGRIISTTDSDSASRSQAFSTCSEIFSHIALMCTPGKTVCLEEGLGASVKSLHKLDKELAGDGMRPEAKGRIVITAEMAAKFQIMLRHIHFHECILNYVEMPLDAQQLESSCQKNNAMLTMLNNALRVLQQFCCADDTGQVVNEQNQLVLFGALPRIMQNAVGASETLFELPRTLRAIVERNNTLCKRFPGRYISEVFTIMNAGKCHPHWLHILKAVVSTSGESPVPSQQDLVMRLLRSSVHSNCEEMSRHLCKDYTGWTHRAAIMADPAQLQGASSVQSSQLLFHIELIDLLSLCCLGDKKSMTRVQMTGLYTFELTMAVLLFLEPYTKKCAPGDVHVNTMYAVKRAHMQFLTQVYLQSFDTELDKTGTFQQVTNFSNGIWDDPSDSQREKCFKLTGVSCEMQYRSLMRMIASELEEVVEAASPAWPNHFIPAKGAAQSSAWPQPLQIPGCPSMKLPASKRPPPAGLAQLSWWCRSMRVPFSSASAGEIAATDLRTCWLRVCGAVLPLLLAYFTHWWGTVFGDTLSVTEQMARLNIARVTVGRIILCLLKLKMMKKMEKYDQGKLLVQQCLDAMKAPAKELGITHINIADTTSPVERSNAFKLKRYRLSWIARPRTTRSMHTMDLNSKSLAEGELLKSAWQQLVEQLANHMQVDLKSLAGVGERKLALMLASESDIQGTSNLNYEDVLSSLCSLLEQASTQEGSSSGRVPVDLMTRLVKSLRGACYVRAASATKLSPDSPLFEEVWVHVTKGHSGLAMPYLKEMQNYMSKRGVVMTAITLVCNNAHTVRAEAMQLLWLLLEGGNNAVQSSIHELLSP
ncbi:hypothetical protein CYMTET_19905, partial [Cymbomonas tetramitiformis]